MIGLSEHTNMVLRNVYVLVAGVGIGFLFHAPYQVFIRALRRKDTASGTSAFFLVRFTGATVGLVCPLAASVVAYLSLIISRPLPVLSLTVGWKRLSLLGSRPPPSCN